MAWENWNSSQTIDMIFYSVKSIQLIRTIHSQGKSNIIRIVCESFQFQCEIISLTRFSCPRKSPITLAVQLDLCTILLWFSSSTVDFGMLAPHSRILLQSRASATTCCSPTILYRTHTRSLSTEKDEQSKSLFCI